MKTFKQFLEATKRSLQGLLWSDIGHGYDDIMWAWIDGKLILGSSRTGRTHTNTFKNKKYAWFGRYDVERDVVTIRPANPDFSIGTKLRVPVKLMSALRKRWPTAFFEARDNSRV